MTSTSTFSGIYPMLYAFFGSDGSLDRDLMRRQVEHAIAAGPHGLAVLGLATEVDKLSDNERRQLLDWTAEDVSGRLPLAVTVFGNEPEIQIEFVQASKAVGADWVILQPPRGEPLSEAELMRFFGTIMDTTDLPVAIQNAPEFLASSLSASGIAELHKQHANFTVLKGEGPVVSIQKVIEATDGKLAVFNGRNGLELPDNLRAGCVGMIPSVETCAIQTRIFNLMASSSPDDEAEAERLYSAILPLLIFVMQGLDSLMCYGKRITAWQMGLEDVRDRAPCLEPTAFGLEVARRHADRLKGL